MGVQINGDTGNVIATKGTFSGDVGIGGTLTYEDVTNIDSVGLITARQGIEVGASPGVAASISVDGNMIVSGISTFGGDVQVPDKIIHAGDTNTALRFPAADTISAETGGTEKLRITSDGKIGIGDDNPNHKVQINNGADDPNIVLLYGADTSTEYAGIGVFQGNATFTGGGIGSNNTGISLRTASGGAELERLRITSSGMVGINTASPTTRLEIVESKIKTWTPTSQTELLVERDGNCIVSIIGKSDSNSVLNFGDEDDENAGAIDYDHNDNSMQFRTAGVSNRLRIDSNGYVHLPAQPIYHAYGNASTGTIESGDNDVPLGFNGESSFSRGITDSNSRSRFTVPVAGIYHIHATVGGSLTTSDQAGDGVDLQLYKNGSLFPAQGHFPAETLGSSSGQEFSLNVTAVMELAASDYIEVALSNIGNVTGTWGHRYFIMYKIM